MAKRNTKSQESYSSWKAYWAFRQEVARDWRYQHSEKTREFLEAVAIGCHSRTAEIPAGRDFFRAQVAHNDDFNAEVGDSFPAPALPERMTPFRDRATEGRVNPKGIPCLYLANDRHTAIAEARPWIGSLVSVGVFRTDRLLKVVDCTRGTEGNPFYIGREPSAAKRAAAVWNNLGRAFRQPATRDDNVAEYAATQIVAEVFRSQGFEGLAYRSAFGPDRFNLALFDIDAAKLIMCSLHEIRDIEFKHEETANPYYVETNADGTSSLVRNVIVDIKPAPAK